MEHVPEGIHQDGVGTVLLGRPLPKDLIPKDIESRYVAGLYADAQPFDGFRLEHPQVLVFLDKGPYQKASLKGYAEPEKAQKLAKQAVQALRQGAKVRLIVVESADVKTEKGVGVGSDLRALKDAYPDIKFWAVPPTFGSDECVAITSSMPSVHFMFSDCKAAEAGGKVVRIIIFRE